MSGSPGRPMLATKGDHVPPGADWVHEIKWDGIRALVDVSGDGTGGTTRVWTRTERDVTAAFPELDDLVDVVDDTLLDGEIIRLGDGVPTLSGLADRIHLTNRAKAVRLAESAPVTLVAFDVLRHDGRDLTREPWSARREVLESLGLADVSWQVPQTYDDGANLLAAAEAQGLEGVVSKRRASGYEMGARSRSWLKFPIRPTGSFVIGGWRPEIGSEQRLGAVLVGERVDDGLVYRGRVGSGLAGRTGRQVADLLAPLTRDTSPFLEVPRLDATGTVWVEPVLTAEIAYLRITDDGRLRQPSFHGVRMDQP